MKNATYLLLPLLTGFISDTQKGKITKPNGKPLSPGTIAQYQNLYRLLQQFELLSGSPISIISAHKLTTRRLQVQKNYWIRFHRNFCRFLYKHCACYDNYVGAQLKLLRSVFWYLQNEKGILCAPYIKTFYVCKEEIPIITLSPSRVQFLITDSNFRKHLPPHLRKVLDIMVFGLTVALRYSDLMALEKKQLTRFQNHWYLIHKAQKTGNQSMVKLPDYILEFIQQQPKKDKKLLPQLSKNQFNLSMKKIGEIAGWTETLPKYRERQGKRSEIYKEARNKTSFRFCDHMSSHMLRRSAITNMLLLGMSEIMVRKISGHAPGSKEFYRYVNIAQSYLDQETDLYQNRLINLGSNDLN